MVTSHKSRQTLERRSGQRVACGDKIRIGPYPNATKIAQLADVSSSGAFVRSPLRLRLFSMVRCRVLDQHDGRLTVLDLVGYVVRAGDDGIGIEWDETSSARVIARLLPLRTSESTQGLAPS